MTRRLLLVVPLAVLALVTGCGGDNASDAPDETVIGGATTKNSSEAAVEILGVRCVELAGISATFTQSLEGQTGSLDDVRFLLDEIAETVPAEIEDDYQVVADGFGKIAEALKDVDYAFGTTQTPEDLQKLRKLARTLDSGKVQEAARNIEVWAEQNC